MPAPSSPDDPSTAGWLDTHAGLCETRRDVGVQGAACASHASLGMYLQEAYAMGQGSDTPPDADAGRHALPAASTNRALIWHACHGSRST